MISYVPTVPAVLIVTPAILRPDFTTAGFASAWTNNTLPLAPHAFNNEANVFVLGSLSCTSSTTSTLPSLAFRLSAEEIARLRIDRVRRLE
ncbi:uncharacterized protein METZ01_LOCUS271617 [marine metagenome]|uniref:Uncharacterized protein n=1 Tax=marine metagenome TaxID=408172 RepID=A0A382K5J0_9ZZZZ